jgi:hypothetical protein
MGARFRAWRDIASAALTQRAEQACELDHVCAQLGGASNGRIITMAGFASQAGMLPVDSKVTRRLHGCGKVLATVDSSAGDAPTLRRCT